MPVSVQSGTAVNAPYLTENHGVPSSNPGPATLKNANLQVKRLRIWIGTSSFMGAHTTTSFSGGDIESGSSIQNEDNRLGRTPLDQRGRQGLDALLEHRLAKSLRG